MKHTYFDSNYRHALYVIAEQEGLLEPLKEYQLGHFKINVKPSNEMKEIILAAITSSNKIYLPPEEMSPKGPLFEGDKFKVLSYDEHAEITKKGDDLPISPDGHFLQALLRENGIPESLEESLALMERAMELEERFAKELPGMTLFAAEFDHRIMPTIVRGHQPKVGAIQMKLVKELQAAYDNVNRIMGPLNYLTTMLRIARRMESKIVTEGVSLPRSSQNSGLISSMSFFNGREISNLDDTRDLFVIVAFELGSTPFRKTLSETLKLADQDETVALQEYVAQKMRKIEANEIGGILDLRSDIHDASKKIAGIDRRNLVSTVLSYVGLPMTFAGFLSAEAGIIGAGMSVAGYYTALRNQRAESELKWAMFGKRPIK